MRAPLPGVPWLLSVACYNDHCSNCPGLMAGRLGRDHRVQCGHECHIEAVAS